MNIALTNAKIFTSDEKNPWAQALVISGDTITYVGPDDERKWKEAGGKDVTVYDLGGKMIIPVGPVHSVQYLKLVTKIGNNIIERELLPVRFVPMV